MHACEDLGIGTRSSSSTGWTFFNIPSLLFFLVYGVNTEQRNRAIALLADRTRLGINYDPRIISLLFVRALIGLIVYRLTGWTTKPEDLALSFHALLIRAGVPEHHALLKPFQVRL